MRQLQNKDPLSEATVIFSPEHHLLCHKTFIIQVFYDQDISEKGTKLIPPQAALPLPKLTNSPCLSKTESLPAPAAGDPQMSLDELPLLCPDCLRRARANQWRYE